VKIIVYPHELAIGGSQINAIDLAGAVRDLGNEVIVYALPGPLEDYIAAKGLRYVRAHHFRYRPSVSHITELGRLIRKEKIDLVHAYEWTACLDAFFGPSLLFGVPMVSTVLSMSVMRLVPYSLPLIMGSQQLADAARRQRGPVFVIEPPIDTDADNPGNDGEGFRAKHGVTRDQILVVTVSRLAIDLKLDALVDAIDSANLLADFWPVRLIIVGDGQAASTLQARAMAVNQRHGREVITMAGATLDPRPAYAAADVVVGMGSSALRALAHAKAVVVQGERGFCAPFDAEHESLFASQGLYGLGDGTSGGPRLAEHLATLFANSELRESLGSRGREFVVNRCSLRAAAQRLFAIYKDVAAGQFRRRTLVGDAARLACLAAGIEIRDHLPAYRRIRSRLAQGRLDRVAVTS
jgi:L-malate glycosyltransferase